MGVVTISVHPVGDKTCRHAVPLIKSLTGAQRIGASSTFLALLRLHVEELPFTAGESYENMAMKREILVFTQ